jgi:uncharacterized SAM-binding protein YcdF (DUF218 family)
METWSYTWAVRNLIAELIMPPGIWLIWVLLILFLYKKNELIKKALIFFGLAMLWVANTNYFANQFTQVAGYLLEWPQPLSLKEIQSQRVAKEKLQPSESHQAQAIVILGGGRQKGAIELPEYQYQNLGPQSMERLRAGVRLAKETNLPILVTGGAPDRTSTQDLSEAELMKKVLERELAISPKWLEEESNTTQENALQSAKILKKEGIKTIYLVTHFWHIPRAKAQFEKQGIQVISAPMGFYQKEQFTPLDFYPSAEGLQKTRWIWHAILGTIWYKLRF